MTLRLSLAAGRAGANKSSVVFSKTVPAIVLIARRVALTPPAARNGVDCTAPTDRHSVAFRLRPRHGELYAGWSVPHTATVPPPLREGGTAARLAARGRQWPQCTRSVGDISSSSSGSEMNAGDGRTACVERARSVGSRRCDLRSVREAAAPLDCRITIALSHPVSRSDCFPRTRAAGGDDVSTDCCARAATWQATR